MTTNLMLAAVLAAARAAAAADQGEVTYARDVAPILFKYCAACHRPGEVAPFSLLEYRAAKNRAGQIAKLTAARRMPPWHAVPGPLKYLDERRLTDGEIATLAKWAKAGAPPGNPALMPPAPQFVPGWQLGQPDKVIKMARPFKLPADGPDRFELFVIPVNIAKATWLKGWEYRPGNREVVHHCNVYLDPTGKALEGAEQLGKDFFRMKAETDQLPFLVMNWVSLGPWNPGTTPRMMRDGFRYEANPRSAIILLIHYHPIGRVQYDQSSVGLHFTNEAPKGEKAINLVLKVLPMLGNGHLLDIKAGARRHKVPLTRTVPGDSTAYRISVHGHYILRDAAVYARLPDGTSLQLLKIKDRDFNWQDRYDFADPPRLPKGTKIEAVGFYDNSKDNPQNPNSPPKDVQYGPNSTDEMFGVDLFLVPDNAEQAALFRPKPKPLPADFRMPKEGLPIPEGAKLIRGSFDKNKDGRLTRDEVEAMPDVVRDRVIAMIAGKTGGKADGSRSPALKLPKEGIRLPKGADVIKQFDKNGDGKLTQDELEAILDDRRAKVEDFLRQQLAGKQPAADLASRVPRDGFRIPEKAKEIREQYDKNGDGRLTADELLAMPEKLREKAISILGKGPGPAEPGGAAAKRPAKLPLPKEGMPIPESAREIRERFDKNKDGKLTVGEIEAMPENYRERIERLVMQRYGVEGNSPRPKDAPAPKEAPGPAKKSAVP
jgi:Ca2+-binding EF-hand superfamily protein